MPPMLVIMNAADAASRSLPRSTDRTGWDARATGVRRDAETQRVGYAHTMPFM